MRRITLSLLAVLGTAFLASAENVPFRKCKALVMSGGAIQIKNESDYKQFTK
jgi:hypothetical protein